MKEFERSERMHCDSPRPECEELQLGEDPNTQGGICHRLEGRGVVGEARSLRATGSVYETPPRSGEEVIENRTTMSSQMAIERARFWSPVISWVLCSCDAVRKGDRE